MLKIEQFHFVFFHDCFKILPDRHTSSILSSILSHISSETHTLHCLFDVLRRRFLVNHIPAAITVAASNAFLFMFGLSEK